MNRRYAVVMFNSCRTDSEQHEGSNNSTSYVDNNPTSQINFINENQQPLRAIEFDNIMQPNETFYLTIYFHLKNKIKTMFNSFHKQMT